MNLLPRALRVQEAKRADVNSSRDPQAGTAAVERQYLQLTTVHGREFQTYSINNSIHMVPVDEVGENAGNHSGAQQNDS